MMLLKKSKIEWTDQTWNPTTGCSKVSKGCKNCYAERLALKSQKKGEPKYKKGFEVVTHPYTLQFPYRWDKPLKIFVNSMSDLFHEDVPFEYIEKVFHVMNSCPQHVFQVLTKRDERLLELSPKLKWSDNIWMGVSIENEETQYRMVNLKQCGAKVKFLSLEPLLEPLPNLDLSGIDWVIVGGESGPNARKMKPEWAIDIKNQCVKSNTPFFFKQNGSRHWHKGYNFLEGEKYLEFPLAYQGAVNK